MSQTHDRLKKIAQTWPRNWKGPASFQQGILFHNEMAQEGRRATRSTERVLQELREEYDSKRQKPAHWEAKFQPFWTSSLAPRAPPIVHGAWTMRRQDPQEGGESSCEAWVQSTCLCDSIFPVAAS